MNSMSLPHISVCDINNVREEKLVMTPGEFKRRVTYLQEPVGKLNHIRSRGRLDIKFALGKISTLVLYLT